jgi:hypothetical protein
MGAAIASVDPDGPLVAERADAFDWISDRDRTERPD